MLHTHRSTAGTIIARGKSVKYRHFTPSKNAPRHVGASAVLARGGMVKYRRITPSSERSGAFGAVRSGALGVAMRVVLAEADGGGTGYANGSTYSFRVNRTMYAQWNIAQVPVGSCVKDGKKPAVPERGTRTLTGRQCKTNAGQRVGTRVQVKSIRGDIRSPKLVCKIGQKTKSTRATGYGDGSRYCANGRLVVRADGSQVRVVVRWSAPAKPGYLAFKSTRTYRT